MTPEEYNKNPKQCFYCGKDILCPDDKLVSSIKKKKFCNHSCATSYNNLQRDKKIYYCMSCGKPIGAGYDKFYGRKYCETCSPNYVDWSKITYGEVKSLRSYQVNSRIRELARVKYYKTHKELKCEICGYSKCVEVHHLKGISTFSDDTPISVINDDSNLIGLCPNHHWEIEHNLLD